MTNKLLAGLLATLPLACLAVGAAQDPGRRALDHDVYPEWSTIEGASLSRQGDWLVYATKPGDQGDGRVHVHGLANEAHYTVDRGASPVVDAAQTFAVCALPPARDDVRAAQKEEKKKDDMPKKGMGLVRLEDGELEVVERVQSFALPEKAGRHVAWLHFEPLKEDKDGEEGEEEAEPEEEPRRSRKRSPPRSRPRRREEEKDEKKKDRKDGTELVLRDLTSGEELRFEHVLEYAFSEDGAWLAYTTSTKDEGDDGVHCVRTADGTSFVLAEGEGHYESLAFDEGCSRLAFLTDRDDYEADQPRWTLYLWETGSEAPKAIARAGQAGVPAGWGVSEHRKPVFSESGGRLFFGTAPLPEPEPEEPFEDEKVVLDVWSWTDDLLQPMQLEQLEEEKKRSYLAVAHLEDGARVVQLGTEEIPEVLLPRDRESAVALGSSNLPYRKMISWDTQTPRDVWSIDVSTGAATEVLHAERGNHRLSPQGRWITWWDGLARTWRAVPSRGGQVVDLGAAIPERPRLRAPRRALPAAFPRDRGLAGRRRRSDPLRQARSVAGGSGGSARARVRDRRGRSARGRAAAPGRPGRRGGGHRSVRAAAAGRLPLRHQGRGVLAGPRPGGCGARGAVHGGAPLLHARPGRGGRRGPLHALDLPGVPGPVGGRNGPVERAPRQRREPAAGAVPVGHGGAGRVDLGRRDRAAGRAVQARGLRPGAEVPDDHVFLRAQLPQPPQLLAADAAPLDHPRALLHEPRLPRVHARHPPTASGIPERVR